MPVAYLHLAFLEACARRPRGGGGRAPARGVVLGPGDAESLALLGVYLSEAGHPREAADLLEPFTRGPRPDLDVLTARGMALAALGRRADALAAFARARETDPSNAMVLVNIGTVHLMDGDVERARRAFDEALGIDPGLARAHNRLDRQGTARPSVPRGIGAVRELTRPATRRGRHFEVGEARDAERFHSRHVEAATEVGALVAVQLDETELRRGDGMPDGVRVGVDEDSDREDLTR